MKAMGIDIGTTTISGVVLDVEKKQVVETRTIPNGSFLGSVGFQENTVLLNMGTGGQISVLSDQLFEGNGIEARPFTRKKQPAVPLSVVR